MDDLQKILSEQMGHRSTRSPAVASHDSHLFNKSMLSQTKAGGVVQNQDHDFDLYFIP